MFKPHYFITLILFLTSCTVGNNYGINLENDVVKHDSDEDYSHGTTLYHSTDLNHANWLSRNVTEQLPLFSETATTTRYNSSLSQEMHHPNNLRETEVIKDDVPYAGFLYGKISRISATENKKLKTDFILGLVGPHAYAEEVQTFVHKDLGFGTTPMGWGNQLNDELIINFGHQRTHREELNCYADELDITDIRLGNAYTDLWYKHQLRGGKIPSLNSNELDGWYSYLFASIGAGLIARNIFYDGNTFEDSHSVNTNPIVGLCEVGIATGYNGYWIKFVYITTTEKFEEQDEQTHSYGSLGFGVDW